VEDLYPNRKKPSHSENIRLARLARQGDPVAREKLIEANTGLAYNNALRYARMNDGRSQIDPEDLLSAAFVGLIEAADRYDPESGHKFVTYAHWWVNKRISEEIKIQHWNTVRPPSRLSRDYLYKNMTPEEADHYVATFMQFAEISPDSHAHHDDIIVDAALIVSTFDRLDLSLAEEAVFSCRYDPRFPPMTKEEASEEMGLSVEEVDRVEKICLEKIRTAMGLTAQST
jgi:RNA polymerase sigma factor (sigma-70 family)